MNWEITDNQYAALQEYRLIDNNDCKLVLKYNPKHQSARVTSGGHHRLIFMESAGSFSGKTVFKNEYGQEVGSLVQAATEGVLIIDQKKYHYRVKESNEQALQVFKDDARQTLLNCSIKAAGNIISSLSNNLSRIDNRCLVLGLCWYLLLPLLNNNLPDYVTAG